jgi:hypothetical protein
MNNNTFLRLTSQVFVIFKTLYLYTYKFPYSMIQLRRVLFKKMEFKFYEN